MRIGPQIKTADSHCLKCGKELCLTSAIVEVGESARLPRPGDWTACLGCGYPMAFKDNMTMRRLTESELKEVRATPQFKAFQWARKQMKR